MSGASRCRRCLLREMTGENSYYESVKFYRETMPPKKRTPDDVYETRLQACKACGSLESGTCMQCGCYVEMRAARIDMHCPDREAKW
ncbi:MAG: hypothetical protein HFF71_00770 [Oscillospiraceae bacterium]|nr:hypothetical protein [Oscillospiraceae bacterium]MCI8941536.1 hypothetical protein [Oscillospiraceae bacterium]